MSDDMIYDTWYMIWCDMIYDILLPFQMHCDILLRYQTHCGNLVPYLMKSDIFLPYQIHCRILIRGIVLFCSLIRYFVIFCSLIGFAVIFCWFSLCAMVFSNLVRGIVIPSSPWQWNCDILHSVHNGIVLSMYVLRNITEHTRKKRMYRSMHRKSERSCWYRINGAGL